MSTPFTTDKSSPYKHRIYLLKGKNKVKPNSWRGMDITLTFIGSFNK